MIGSTAEGDITSVGNAKYIRTCGLLLHKVTGTRFVDEDAARVCRGICLYTQCKLQELGACQPAELARVKFVRRRRDPLHRYHLAIAATRSERCARCVGVTDVHREPQCVLVPVATITKCGYRP